MLATAAVPGPTKLLCLCSGVYIGRLWQSKQPPAHCITHNPHLATPADFSRCAVKHSHTPHPSVATIPPPLSCCRCWTLNPTAAAAAAAAATAAAAAIAAIAAAAIAAAAIAAAAAAATTAAHEDPHHHQPRLPRPVHVQHAHQAQVRQILSGYLFGCCYISFSSCICTCLSAGSRLLLTLHICSSDASERREFISQCQRL